jgi:phage/plasmid-like protein (TIGR03299 family)
MTTDSMTGVEVLENGKLSMFAGEDYAPWSGISKSIAGKATAKEALELAGLDWTVEKQPLYFGENKEIYTGRHAVVRTKDNKELGIVSAGYHLFQNEEAFSFFDNLVDSKEAKYTAAGSLFGGKRVFMTAEIGEEVLIAGEDAHKTYLLLANSHDGSQAFTAAVTKIRVRCWNSVQMGIRGSKHKWSLRHQTSLSGRIAEAREALAMTFKYDDAFEQRVQELMSIPVNADQFKKIAEDVVPKSKVQHAKSVTSLMDVFENEKTVIDAPGVGTAWGAYNAMTFWTDHVKSYHNDLSRFKSLADAGFAEKARNKTHTRLLALSR